MPGKEKETRNFALRDAKGNETSVFTGKSPRQAALKAASRGHKDIRLREHGTKKVHVFVGERVQVERPTRAPASMGNKIWKPDVRKVGTKRRACSSNLMSRVRRIIYRLITIIHHG